MLQKKKTIDMVVAIALLIAGLFTFVSLFGNFAAAKTNFHASGGMNFIDLLKDGSKAIQIGFENDYILFSVALIYLLSIIIFFIGLVLFLTFGIIGMINVIHHLQGKKELKTNPLLIAVFSKAACDLFIFYLVYSDFTQNNYGTIIKQETMLGWGSILSIISCFIILIAYSFRYIYFARLLKKNLLVPAMMCGGVLLVLIASIIGSHGQFHVTDLNSETYSKMNGLDLTITAISIDAREPNVMTNDIRLCEIGGIFTITSPLLCLVVFDFFKISKRKKDFLMVLDGTIFLVFTLIGSVLISSSSTATGYSSYQTGTGLIVSLVLTSIATILFLVCLIIHKDRNITLKPEELAEEMISYKEETSSSSESSDESSKEEAKEDNINAAL